MIHILELFMIWNILGAIITMIYTIRWLEDVDDLIELRQKQRSIAWFLCPIGYLFIGV